MQTDVLKNSVIIIVIKLYRQENVGFVQLFLTGWFTSIWWMPCDSHKRLAKITAIVHQLHWTNAWAVPRAEPINSRLHKDENNKMKNKKPVIPKILCWTTLVCKSLQSNKWVKLRKCNQTIPVCNAKRCGERWGWRFSSHQHLERFSSASQNTLWGALA